jgi:hypothetical protein
VSRAKDSIDVNVGPALTPGAPFPDATTWLHDVGVQAEVRIYDRLRARVGWLYERLDVDDWAREAVGPATIGEVLALGQENPDYGAYLVAMSLAYEF